MTQPIPGPLVFDDRSSSGHRLKFRGLPVGLEAMLNYKIFMDDFDRVALDSATDHRWTIVGDDGSAEIIEPDVEHGVMSLTSDAEDEGSSIQGNEIVKFEAGKRLFFEARVAMTDGDDSAMGIGLVENFGTNPEAFASAAGVGFIKAKESANILAGAGTAFVSQEDTGVDMGDLTYVKLSIVHDGGDEIDFYVNDVKKVSLTLASAPTGLLTPAAYTLCGAASDKLLIDYIFVAKER